jgi:hypothetical protein
MRKPKTKKAATKVIAKPAQVDLVDAKRARAYAEMEPHLCDIVRMGEIAFMLFDDPDQGRFIFAVTHLDDMLRAFRTRYYAPVMKRRRRSHRKRNRQRLASHARRLRR